MLFFHARYKYVLGSRHIQATLKNKAVPESLHLDVIVEGIQFLAMPVCSSFIKKARLANGEGSIIPVEHYSQEVKREVEELKRKLKIPYFKLWRGALILLSIVCIALGTKKQIEAVAYTFQKQNLAANLQQIKVGQLYGAIFFSDSEGNDLSGLPSGWVRIQRIDGDTIFLQRSKKMLKKPIIKFKDFEQIKPRSEADWSSKLEKIDCPLVKEAAKSDQLTGVDLFYIGEGLEKNFGIVMTLKTAGN